MLPTDSCLEQTFSYIGNLVSYVRKTSRNTFFLFLLVLFIAADGSRDVPSIVCYIDSALSFMFFLKLITSWSYSVSIYIEVIIKSAVARLTAIGIS